MCVCVCVRVCKSHSGNDQEMVNVVNEYRNRNTELMTGFSKNIWYLGERGMTMWIWNKDIYL